MIVAQKANDLVLRHVERQGQAFQDELSWCQCLIELLRHVVKVTGARSPT